MPQSHVFSLLPKWNNTFGAYLMTPAIGSHFVMYLAKTQVLILFVYVFVIQGTVTVSDTSGISNKLRVDSYVYLPPNFQHSLNCDDSATLVIFERRYAYLNDHSTKQIIG
ncbi:hypothetical protein SLE2022_226040 [Rubroshorea leprosula]